MRRQWFQGWPVICKGGPGSGNFAHAGRPGMRGGSMAHSSAVPLGILSGAAEEAVSMFEQSIRRSPIEKAGAYDPETGALIFYKEGTETSVSFVQGEYNRMEGAVLTHNHPSGSSFSASDIKLLANRRLASIRAAGSTGKTYTMHRSENTPQWSTMIPKVFPIRDQVQREFLTKIQRGAMTVEEAESQHNHELWGRVAREHPELGLTYEVTG